MHIMLSVQKGTSLVPGNCLQKWIFQKEGSESLTLDSDKVWIEKVREMKEGLQYLTKVCLVKSLVGQRLHSIKDSLVNRKFSDL